MKSKLTQYKILSLDASDLYERIKYDGRGNKIDNGFYLINTFINNQLNPLYKSSMTDNLDTLYIKERLLDKNPKNPFKEDIIFKEILIDKIKHTIFLPFISLSFERKSKHFNKKTVYEKFFKNDKESYVKRTFYVKRGYYGVSNQELLDNCKNHIVTIDNNICAVEVDGEKTDEIEEIIKPKKANINDPLSFFTKKNGKYSYNNSDVDSIDKLKLREYLYDNGFNINYDNGITINYKRYKRSASNARGGRCLFINSCLLNSMNDWSYCKMPQDDLKVENMPVEMEAYKSLSLSSIKDSLRLETKNILLIEDYEFEFDEECIGVDIHEGNTLNEADNYLEAKKTNIKVLSNIWDGEGLLDESLFAENKYKNKGMLLLRNRFFKSCCFNTRLQKYLKDNNVTLDDIKKNGYTRATCIEDIKLVITTSSLKIIKFKDKDFPLEFIFDYWLNIVKDKNGFINFGVVKTDKKTKRFDGNMVSTSYQFLNTLPLTREDCIKLCKPTIDYLNLIQSKSQVFKFYLDGEKDKTIDDKLIDSFLEEDYDDLSLEDSLSFDDNETDTDFFNYKNEVCNKLISINDRFDQTALYSVYKKDIIHSLRQKVNRGRVLINGTFATIFGNGYELLQRIHGKFNESNYVIKPYEVMCKMFNENDKLTCVRFPHITMGNVYTVTNTCKKEYLDYFNLSNEIVCVNSINDSIQQRLNGCDYDSDTMLITNNEIIYNSAKDLKNKFLVPYNMAVPQKVTNKELAKIDDLISNGKVGEITNASQWLNSILWDMLNEGNGDIDKVYNNICKLAVLSNMEIDKAKRYYHISAQKELSRIRTFKESLDIKYVNKPDFLGEISIRRYSNINKANIENKMIHYKTSMSYIYEIDCVNGEEKNTKTLPLLDILNPDELAKLRTKTSGDSYKQAKKVFALLQETTDKIKKIDIECVNTLNGEIDKEKQLNVKRDYSLKKKSILQDLKIEIGKSLDNPNSFVCLLKLLDKEREANKKNKSFSNSYEVIEKYIWSLLYVMHTREINGENLLERLFKSPKPVSNLYIDSNGDIEIFNKKYTIK